MLYWTILCLCLQARNPGSNQEPLSPSTRGANSASLRVEDDVTMDSIKKYIKGGNSRCSDIPDEHPKNNFNRLASAFDGFTAETAKESAQFFRETAKTLPGMSLTETLATQNCDTILKGLTTTSDKKEYCQDRIKIMIDHRNDVSAEDFENLMSQQIPQIAGDRTEHIKTIIAGDIIIIDYINPKNSFWNMLFSLFKKLQALTDKKEGAAKPVKSIEEAIDFVVHVKDGLTIDDNSGNFMNDVKRLENLEPLLTFFAGVKSQWKIQLMEDDEEEEVIKEMETKLKPFEHFISAVTVMFDFDEECNIKQNKIQRSVASTFYSAQVP